jgi:hypothetical protein
MQRRSSHPALLQADPSLPEKESRLLAEFEAAPWLLPPRTTALRYAGVHDLDRLLQLRAIPIGSQPKTVTLLTFSRRMAVMMQNSSELAPFAAVHASRSWWAAPGSQTCPS